MSLIDCLNEYFEAIIEVRRASLNRVHRSVDFQVDKALTHDKRQIYRVSKYFEISPRRQSIEA